MSLPLCVLPSPKTWTPSSRMARTMAVVVTARPSGVVLKYLRPAAAEVERAALDRDDPLAHQGLAAVDQPRRLGAVLQRHRRDVRRRLLVGLRQVGGVGVDLEALAGQPGDRAAGVEPAREGDPDLAAGRRYLAMNAAHGRSHITTARTGGARINDEPETEPAPRSRPHVGRDLTWVETSRCGEARHQNGRHEDHLQRKPRQQRHHRAPADPQALAGRARVGRPAGAFPSAPRR